MSNRIPTALFFIAVSTFCFFVILSRLLGVFLPPGEFLLYVLTSFGFMGMALASVQVLSKWLHDVDIDRYGFFVSVLIAGASLFTWTLLSVGRSTESWGSATGITILVFTWIFAATVFFASGFVFGCGLYFYPDKLKQWLLAGFGGAAVGTILGGFGLSVFYGACALLFCMVLAFIGAGLMNWEERKKPPFIAISVAGGLVIFFLALFAIGAAFDRFFMPRFMYQSKSTLSGPEAWNGLSLATVVGNGEETKFAINQKVFPQFTCNADEKGRFVAVNGLAFPLLVEPDVLVLGPTTDTALEDLGREGTTVSWLDPHDQKAVCQTFSELAGGCLPAGSEIRNINPKLWMARSGKKFDLVHLSIFNAPFAWQTGPFAIFGDPLTTLESFNSAFGRLDEGGVFQILSSAETEERLVRLTAMAVHTLKKRLAANPDSHLFLAGDEKVVSILVKREPFSIHEVTRLLDYCHDKKLRVFYSPFKQNPESRLQQAAVAREIETFYPKDQLPSDDHPFYFNLSAKERKQAPIPQIEMIKKLRSYQSRSFLIAGIWLLCAGLFPLFAVRAHRMILDEFLRRLAFFLVAVVGLTLMVSTVLYSFQIFLDYPRSLPFWGGGVLFFFAGLGALYGARMEETGPFPKAKRLLLAAFCTGLAVDVIGPILFHRFHGSFQVLIALMLLAVLGAFFGAPVGYCLKRMHRPHRNVTAWMAGVVVASFAFGVAFSAVLAGAVGYTGMLWFGLTLVFGSMWLWSES